MSFEPVEWERLADHEEGEPAAASAVAPMTDERLAHLTQVFVDQDPRDWFAKDGLANVIRELLGEAKLQRGRAETAERELAKAYDEYANLEAETLRIADRAGACHKELAEVPERIAGAIVNMPEPEAPDSYAVPAWYDGYEQAVEDAARTAREWKAAKGA